MKDKVREKSILYELSERFMNAVSRQRQRTAQILIVISRILVLSAIILICITGMLGIYLVVAQNETQTQPITAFSAVKSTTLAHNDQPSITPSKYQQQVKELGRQYINALLKQNYNTMWPLLNPQVQQKWPDENAFANFQNKRFHGFTLQGVSVGEVYDLSYWIDPETMIRYNQVEVMPISLQLTAQASATQLPSLAVPDQHASDLLQNIPFVVQRASIGAGKGEGNQWFILSGGPADPEAPILPPTIPVNSNVKVPILMYHYISNIPVGDPNPTLRASLSIAPEVFSQQLDYLKAQKFQTITFNQLLNALYYNAPLPPKPIILTFDDGYDDAYTDAYPILKAHGYNGTFYIVTSFVEQKRYVKWDQLREMLANGMQIGSHTIHHSNLGIIAQSQLEQELQISQSTLEKQLNIVIQHFCYPNGDPFKGHDLIAQKRVVNQLQLSGYTDATTDPGPTGTTQSSQTPYVLLRLRIDGRSTLATYEKMLQTNT